MYQKMIAVGYVSKPELNLSKKFLKFTLKTYKSFMKNGQREAVNTYFSCVMFSGSLETFASLITDGSLLFCEGEIIFNRVVSETGKTTYFTSFKIENFRLLSKKDVGPLSGEDDEEDRPLSKSNQKLVARFKEDDFFSEKEIPF